MAQQSLTLELTNTINSAYDQFIAALDRFTEQQINVVPFEGSWTPGQVTHHIIRATKGIPDKNTTPANRPIDEKVVDIESVFLNFNVKFTSPEFILPDTTVTFDKTNLLERLNTIRHRHIENMERTNLSEVCVDFDLPGIGYLTRYEWYQFIAAHCRRHTFQLEKMLEAVNV